MGLKLKELEGALQPLQRFADAKADLEQYPTSSHLASRMLFTALQSFREIEGQKVLDLGCGCGILSIASVICGAE
jgi:putative methylase